MSAAELARVEDDPSASGEAAERRGLKLATDGEFRRKEWHMDFLSSSPTCGSAVPDQAALPHHEGDTE